MPFPASLQARRAFLSTALSSPWWSSAAAQTAADNRPTSFQSDAELLARAYGALHPGLYRYNTPAQMAACFDGLRAYLSVPRTQTQAYVAFARATAAVRCGHSYPNFYNQAPALRASLFSGRDRLPFHFRWIADRMVITRDLSASGLAVGTEVLSVNGLPAQAMLQALLPLARADGSNDAKRRRQMDVTGVDRWEAFDIYMPMLLPHIVARREVTLSVRDPGGGERGVAVAQMTAAERAAAAPSPIARPPDAALWTLSQRPGGISLLQMPSWSLYNSRWDWRAWLEAALDQVATDGTRGLVVDLRANEGGLDCGDPILARLVDQELRVAGPVRRVRYRKLPDDLAAHVDTWDDSFRDWGADAVGPRADGFYDLMRWSDDASGNLLVRPAGKRFKGRLVVLVDAVNSSATFQFAQTVKDAKLGQLVGATTGGNRRGINGGAFFFLRLPASGIEVDIPLVGYFPATTQPDAGVEPDWAIADSLADVISGVDRSLDSARRLLR
jgi:hypothetical protein